MKLVLKGHDERYVVEQGMLNLFPGERPVYEPIGPEDDTWARVSLRRTAVPWRWSCPGGGRRQPTGWTPP